MIGRIVRSVDFERVLCTPIRARSAHFAIHHVEGAPSLPRKPSTHKLSTELSTGRMTADLRPVDDRAEPAPAAAGAAWVGAVVPKRHAKRSVTRSLLKRQIRAAVGRQAALTAGLPHGLWVVRLRSPFATKDFPSAASTALLEAARAELDTLLADAVRRTSRG